MLKKGKEYQGQHGANDQFKLSLGKLTMLTQSMQSADHFFWLIRSLVDPTLAAFIVCGSLQFVLLIYEFSDRRLGSFLRSNTLRF